LLQLSIPTALLLQLAATDPFFNSRGSSKGPSKTARQQAARKQRSSKAKSTADFKWRGAWQQHTWSDAARAQAAAAAQLSPEELHNLVFGQDEDDMFGSYSSGSSSSKDRRRQRREQRRRARRMQSRAARERATGSSFSYAEFAYWTDADAYDDDVSSDEEDYWQAYGRYGQQQRQQQQHYWWGASGRPDWQWWTEEQER
jgi:hypothetical protein